MVSQAINNKLYYILRISSAMCLIGHGVFGVITKLVWCNYFAVFGIGHDLAYKIMPVLGIADILMGITLLIYPISAIVLWLVIWGFVTAALRPLSGEPFPELIERAGNFGAPLVLLMLSGSVSKSLKSLFARIKPARDISSDMLLKISYFLRVIVFLLFLGHGWLNVVQKQGLLNQYAALGFSNAGNTAQFIGLFELVAAVSVLLRPVSSVLIILLIWKIASELFYPHWEMFELVERGGSYGCILSLWLLVQFSKVESDKGFLIRNRIISASQKVIT